MRILNSLAKFNVLPVWRREVRVWGYRVTAPSLDRLLCLALHRVGLMGRAERALFREWIHPGMIVVDAGANQGLYSLLFSSLVGPSGRVIAFEPEPEMFESLAQNCRANDARNVELVPKGLGSRSGAAVLSRSLVHGGDNRLAPGHRADLARRIPVPIVALDEVMGDSRVDFIKIDVQGWEWEVLRGMEAVLKNNSHVRIYFEFWPQGLLNAGCDPRELLAYLSDRGFRLMEQTRHGFSVLRDYSELESTLTGYRFINVYAERAS